MGETTTNQTNWRESIFLFVRFVRFVVSPLLFFEQSTVDKILFGTKIVPE